VHFPTDTSYTTAGLVNGNTVTNVIETSAGAVSTANVGTYAIDVSAAVGPGLPNYNINYVDGTLNVTPATATIVVTPYSVTYNGLAHSATGTATGVGGVNLGSDLTISSTHTNAGTYTDSWSFNAGSNYKTASGTMTDTIAQANASVIVTPYDVTYNNQAHTATGTATGVGGVNLPASDLNLTGTTHTTAGTYSDTWTFSDPNYVSQTGTVTDTIQKANATIAVTLYDVTYTGTAHSATGTATGVGGVNLASDLTIISTHTNAGTYTDSWSFNAGNNYNTASGTMTDIINKANAHIIVSPYNVLFDGCAHIATGIAIGVNGQALSGLNLGGTVHLGGYNTTIFYDRWTFTDTTGNYNSTSGVVVDVIRGNQALYRAMYHPFCPKSVFYGRLFMW